MSGCRIITGAAPSADVVAQFSDEILDEIYRGGLPAKVVGDPAHRAFSDWAVAHAKRIERSAPVSVWLRFGGRRNLGDISTGPIKAMLDGLAGVLGADQWRDVDDRVVTLITEQAVANVPEAFVGVTVSA
jgi:hypothetical protein